MGGRATAIQAVKKAAVVWQRVYQQTAAHALLFPLAHPSLHNPTPPSFFGIRSALRSCAIGASGVIFALLVVDNAASARGASSSVSLLGRAEVPAPLVPWLLLLVIQVAVPSASFVGHVAGVLAGEAWALGLLGRFSPSDAAVARAEASPAFEAHARRAGAVVSVATVLPVWRGAGAAGGSGGDLIATGGGGGSSSSSVGAAWHLMRSGAAAAWARLPPAQREEALSRYAKLRLAARENWTRLVAALPPAVVEAVASAAASAHALLPPALARALSARGGGAGSDDDEEAAVEAAPLIGVRTVSGANLGGGGGGGGGSASGGGGGGGAADEADAVSGSFSAGGAAPSPARRKATGAAAAAAAAADGDDAATSGPPAAG